MTTINVETLAKENVRLYEENLKLKLMLNKGTSELKVKAKKDNKQTKSTKANNKRENTMNKYMPRNLTI